MEALTLTLALALALALTLALTCRCRSTKQKWPPPPSRPCGHAARMYALSLVSSALQMDLAEW